MGYQNNTKMAAFFAYQDNGSLLQTTFFYFFSLHWKIYLCRIQKGV